MSILDPLRPYAEAIKWGAIRDVCVPQRDVDCMAAQLVAQCRLWAGTPNGPGLCNRRKDEARLAQS